MLEPAQSEPVTLISQHRFQGQPVSTLKSTLWVYLHHRKQQMLQSQGFSPLSIQIISMSQAQIALVIIWCNPLENIKDVGSRNGEKEYTAKGVSLWGNRCWRNPVLLPCPRSWLPLSFPSPALVCMWERAKTTGAIHTPPSGEPLRAQPAQQWKYIFHHLECQSPERLKGKQVTEPQLVTRRAELQYSSGQWSLVVG